MIPAQPGHMVRFDDDASYDLRVIAWTDDGVPLVAGEHTLVPAEEEARRGEHREFRLIWSIIESAQVAAMPADPGWRVRVHYGDCMREHSDYPIRAWAVSEEGVITPIVHADGNWVMAPLIPEASPGRWSLLAPDDTE